MPTAQTSAPAPLPAPDPIAEADRRCRNCGAALTGPFCALCGQADEPPLMPVGRWLRTRLGELFSLDRRSFRSLWALLRPAALTQAYLDGHRVRYTSPMRLYLVAALVYFSVQALTGGGVYFGGMLRVGGDGFDQSRFLAWLNRMSILVPFGWAVVLKGLYRRTLYIAHVICALHVQALAFLCWAVSTAALALAPSASPTDPLAWLVSLVQGVFGLLPWIYLFFSLRRIHGEGRLRTLTKTLAALFGYALVLALLTALALALLAAFD